MKVAGYAIAIANMGEDNTVMPILGMFQDIHQNTPIVQNVKILQYNDMD
jgi:hypothetical protein